MSKPSSINIAEEADKLYSNLCKQYGEYFNYVREQKGLSLRELSRQTNISIALISLLENGDKLPRIETLIRLVLALEIPFGEVFGNKSNGMEFTYNREKVVKRDDEALRKALLRLGCNKDDIKDIRKFIKFKIFMQQLDKLSPAAKDNILTEIIISGNVSKETLDYSQSFTK